MQDLADNYDDYGVDIVSISWGYPLGSAAMLDDQLIDDMDSALDTLIAGGVTIFCAAGNENLYDELAWPANRSNGKAGLVSVGYVYDDTYPVGKHAGERYHTTSIPGEGEGSNFDSNPAGPSVAAVGYSISTTADDGSSWTDKTGSSYSTPVAAGIAACLLEQYQTVPTSQRPDPITPGFIDSQLCDNAEVIFGMGVGNGVIRPVESMINWYDYVDTKTVTYGTVSSFSNLQTGSGNAVFDETAYDEYKTWTEGFSSVPPSGWTKTGGWKKANIGGQSGSYANCRVQELPPLGSGYLQSKDYDTSDADRVYLEFYHKNGFYGGTLRVYVRDQGGYWDLIGTYNYDYCWTKETWSSTSFQYQHDNFAVKYDVEVSESQWVGVDTHQVKMRYEDDTYRFSHEFQFTSISYDGYDDATLQFDIVSHTGSEYLILEYYDSGWHTLNSTLGTGTHSFDVGEHISSSEFRIRIRSATHSRDTSQDGWTISALRLLVLDSSVDLYT